MHYVLQSSPQTLQHVIVILQLRALKLEEVKHGGQVSVIVKSTGYGMKHS